MNNQKIPKLIKNEKGRRLKISMSLCVLSLVLLATLTVFVAQQYLQLKADYIDTANPNIITINYKSGEEPNSSNMLDFKDEGKINEFLKDEEGAYSYSEYVMRLDIRDEDGNGYYLTAYDNASLEKFGVDKINDNEGIIRSDQTSKDITLKLPVIIHGSGGQTSGEYKDMNLSLTPSTTDIGPFHDFEMLPEQIIVNAKTYREIIELMYQVPWTEFKANTYVDGPYSISPINSITVYVDNLDNVKEIATKLDENGYNTYCVPEAFDDLQNHLKKTYITYFLLVAFIIVVTGANMIKSFKQYLYSMQKDIGIFRHYGYKASKVYDIYKDLIIMPFIKVAGLTTVYCLALSLLLLHQAFIKPFIISFVMIIFFIGIVLIILLKILKKLCNKEILVLLNQSKEA